MNKPTPVYWYSLSTKNMILENKLKMESCFCKWTIQKINSQYAIFIAALENNLFFFFFCSYYMEILQQEYAGAAKVSIALFQGESSFTEDQTDDAVNEVQNIKAEYDAFDEEQVCIC